MQDFEKNQSNLSQTLMTVGEGGEDRVQGSKDQKRALLVVGAGIVLAASFIGAAIVQSSLSKRDLDSPTSLGIDMAVALGSLGLYASMAFCYFRAVKKARTVHFKEPERVQESPDVLATEEEVLKDTLGVVKGKGLVFSSEVLRGPLLAACFLEEGAGSELSPTP
ncbi:MAG: hypothetical protein NTV32_03785 [Gammaproteobacteria bacterium]|nr:hypothetical protein [Gammaproteobacteria bacterium]